MEKPKLEVIRFEEEDIVTASGLGMTASGFADPDVFASFTFFGGSSGKEEHGAHDSGLLDAFKRYFGNNSWNSVGDISVDGYYSGELGFPLYADSENLSFEGVDGTYSYSGWNFKSTN